MARLGSSAQATIRQFAGQMELEPYEAPDGAYSFEFERSGRLSIVASEDGPIVISLTSRLLLGDLRGYARLAALGGYDAGRDLMVHCGLNRSGQPVLAVRSDPREFSLPHLLECQALLTDRLRVFGG